jgi:hypothetical protein
MKIEQGIISRKHIIRANFVKVIRFFTWKKNQTNIKKNNPINLCAFNDGHCKLFVLAGRVMF